MDENNKFEAIKDFGNNIELVKSVPDKHVDLLRPAARYYSVLKDVVPRGKHKYALVREAEDLELGVYEKPLPCFGCGIGWFSFLLGFVFPFMWYYSTFLYLGSYYRKDPRERAGLAASAIAAMGFSIVLLVIVAFRVF